MKLLSASRSSFSLGLKKKKARLLRLWHTCRQIKSAAAATLLRSFLHVFGATHVLLVARCGCWWNTWVHDNELWQRWMEKESCDVVPSGALDLLFHLPPNLLLKVKVQVQRPACVLVVRCRVDSTQLHLTFSRQPVHWVVSCFLLLYIVLFDTQWLVMFNLIRRALTLVPNTYLHQGGSVFGSVCLLVSKISWKVMNILFWIFLQYAGQKKSPDWDKKKNHISLSSSLIVLKLTSTHWGWVPLYSPKISNESVKICRQDKSVKLILEARTEKSLKIEFDSNWHVWHDAELQKKRCRLNYWHDKSVKDLNLLQSRPKPS